MPEQVNSKDRAIHWAMERLAIFIPCPSRGVWAILKEDAVRTIRFQYQQTLYPTGIAGVETIGSSPGEAIS
jgi:hypothetical protein